MWVELKGRDDDVLRLRIDRILAVASGGFGPHSCRVFVEGVGVPFTVPMSVEAVRESIADAPCAAPWLAFETHPGGTACRIRADRIEYLTSIGACTVPGEERPARTEIRTMTGQSFVVLGELADVEARVVTARLLSA